MGKLIEFGLFIVVPFSIGAIIVFGAVVILSAPL